MTATDVIDACRTRGVTLFVADGEVRYRAPQGAFTDELRTVVRQHKAELLELLPPAPAPSHIARCSKCGGTNWGYSGQYAEDGAEVWRCLACSPLALPASSGEPLNTLEFELLDRLYTARGRGPTIKEIAERLDQPHRIVAAIFEPLAHRGLTREEQGGALYLTDLGAKILREWRGEPPMENESSRPRATPDPRHWHRLGEPPPLEACPQCGGGWRESVYLWACKGCGHTLEKTDG